MPGSARHRVITLTSDFGLVDPYVAEMKGVLLRYCPGAVLIDNTHLLGPQDVLAGSLALGRVLTAFGAGTVHLAVVDPGVGTDRKLLIWQGKEQTVVCPDNGLITWPTRLFGPGKAWEITWRARQFSETFHGRDIMAPVAARLASGVPIRSLARALDDPVLLNIAPSRDRTGVVIHIDHFGNAITNLPASTASLGSWTVGRRKIGPVCRTYADVAPGRALVLVGSSGLIEIAVRNGSAAKQLKLKVGDKVAIGLSS